MGFLDNILLGFGIALSFQNILYAVLGVGLGTAVGVLPGLGSAATIALLLPITYKIEPISAIIMLAGIYYGAMYGGSTTSILLKIPGEASSVITCIDGYQMALQGRAGPALGISAIGSFFAGTLGVLGLSLIAPSVTDFALQFGPVDYTSLVILGLIMSVYLSEESTLKGLITITIGLLIASVGLDPVQGVARFSFGVARLRDGFDFVVVAMGLYGIAEILINLEAPENRDLLKTSLKGLLPNRDDWKRSWAPIVRGSILGFLVGVLPGGGGVISSFGSYAIEKRLSKHPEEFGKGAIEGVAAPEAANNSAASSAFIPLLTLGIPGNPSMAMIFIALLIHGIRPGPMILQEHPDLFWGFIASMYIGNIMLLAINLPLIGLWVRLLTVPYRYLVVIIVIVCGIGAYSVSNSSFDIGIMMIFGVIGYLMKKGGFPPAPLILSMILCPVLEKNIRRSLIVSEGDFFVFFQHPISLTLLLIALFLMFIPLVRQWWKKRHSHFSDQTI